MSGQKTKLAKPRDSSKRASNGIKTSVRDVRLLLQIPSRRTETHNAFCTTCKDTGALLSCDHCMRSYHLVCVNMRLEDVPYGPWYCHICIPTVDRKYREETAKQEKADKQLKDQEVKKLLAKLNNNQKNKAVKKFAKKHPQFVKLAKIHYPIDDLLLYQDPLLHQVTLTDPKPLPHKYTVPPHLLGDLLYITDFTWTFREVLQIIPPTLDKLFIDLCKTEETSLLREILMSFVRLILESCLNKEAEVALMPASQLTLLCKLIDLVDIKAMVPVCYLSLLSEILRSPMWKVYAEDSKELNHLAKHKLSVASIDDIYYAHCTYEEKVALLVFAIHCLFDTKTIHEDLTARLEERHKLAKLRQEIKGEMRTIESKAKAKDKNGAVTRLSQTSTEKISRLEERLRKETEALSEVTVRTQSLGLDRDYNEYFMFNFDRSKLFVRLPTPLETVVRKPKDESGYWYIYNTKQEVDQVLSSLCNKGIRESNLIECLSAAMSKFRFSEGDYGEGSADRPYTNKYSSFEHVDCTLEGIRKAVLSLEKGFTAHLAKTSKQWELPIPRNDWIDLVNSESSAEGLAQLLLEFGTKANTPYKTLLNQPSSEDEEQEGDETHYRRVNLRIWQDFGESFALWSFLLESCKTSNSLHFCILIFDSVLHNYYRKRPDRVAEKLKKVELESPIKTRRKRTEEQKDSSEPAGRKRPKTNELEHDDVCFFCSKYGELMCCETCSRVVHPSCIGLEIVPTEDWFCDECLSKQEAVPQTRSRTRLRKIA